MDDQEADAAIAHEAIEAKEASRHERDEVTAKLNRNTGTTVILIVIAILVCTNTAVSFLSNSSSQDAKASADAAKTAAVGATNTARETRRLVNDQRRQNDDASCRSLFAAPVTDASTAQSSASSDLLIALTGQAASALSGDDLEAKDLSGVVIASALLTDTSTVRDEANRQYQDLLRAQRDDRQLFDKMCRQGPQGLAPS